MDVDSDQEPQEAEESLLMSLKFEDPDEFAERCIKSEITFEPEKITETTFMEMPMEQLFQVEVGTSEIEHESTDKDKVEALLQSHIEKFAGKQYEEHIESQLSDILSDHNYTSQELVVNQPKIDNIKDVLLNHIVTNVANVPDKITKFINSTVDSIKLLQLEAADAPSTSSSNDIVVEFVAPADVSLNLDIVPSSGSLSPANDRKLPENCSEPLEVEQNDEYFESLYKSIGESRTLQKPILNDTMDFAKELYTKCKEFTEDSESELKQFLIEQIKKLQAIANVGQKEQAVQTNSKSSLKKRRRSNYNAKRKLLLDTSGSSNLDSDCPSSCDEQNTEARLKPEDSVSGSDSDIHHNSKHNNVNTLNQEYMDGIDLSKYIKLDISHRKYRESSSESDKENKETVPGTSENDTDKEIERLTNLSGLNKRHVQSRNNKLCDEEKSKHKTLSKKDTNNIDDLLPDELETYESDNSFNKSEDEIITENQYLSRYNEQIKLQLLNESNSDSGLSDQSDDYNLSKESSSEENESKRDIVDQFLQVFQSDKSDPEEVNGDDNDSDAAKLNKSEIEQEKKEADALDSNDELWNNNFLDQKRTKAKSLEKMLAEAEKRNKNEEIVLSSESDYSDVEAVEAEPVEEKSRLIKPMLRMDQLANETRVAQKSETERIRRLEKKHTTLSKAVKNNSGKLNTSDLILDYIESTKTFIRVDEDIVKHLKPHQIDGLKFMYDSCYGGADHTKKTSGSGCILAHCMGLGKTLQLIALLHTVISYKELNTAKVLVLCPKSTVMNWADELQRWLGPLKKNRHIQVFAFPDASDISEKLRVLEEWSLSSSDKAGCLLVGYEAFRTLVFYHSYKNRGHLSSAKLENIRDRVNKYLLEPGADLVVCDEGHIIKNSKSAISLAVAKIVTPKRIILTGTPIQNNLKEYYSMVNFIKPLYLGTEKEFANLYANPIKNGQHKDSSKKDITVMKQRSFVLHKKLSKFVQRKEAELLKTFLPQKFEYVLFIPMTTVQNTLYEFILEHIARRGDSRGKSLITDYTVLRKIWTHPKVLEDAWKNATKLQLQKNKKDAQKKPPSPHSDDDQPDDIYDSQNGPISVNNDWWRRFLSNKDLETVMPSNKLRTMFAILRMCEEKGEKCLIFSAFVAVLNVVEYFFKKITESDPEILQQIHLSTNLSANPKISNTWINGQDYYRLDGRTPKNIRHEMIKRFNSDANKRARVFLISAKAGGQGINLIGANRVIILDTSWNPSNDQQNIFRIFRLGQKKNCYIYRMIAMGTMEEKVYSRSVTKQAMSFRVVDEQQIDRHYNMAELAELYTLTTPQSSERTMPVLPKDTILAHLLLSQSELVYKYHEHDSLLENKVEQELSEQEKEIAWAAYERELQMNLAQQEGFNAEKNPNAFPQNKLPSYLGQVPGLDMQTLLNYSIQSASVMPHYGYGMSPNYLDALNMYQTISAMRYQDINNFGDNSYPPAYNAMNPQNHNHPQSGASILSSMQNIAPKSLQNDFGMFDINAQKARSGSSGGGGGSALNLPQLQHPLSTEVPSPAIATTNANLANNPNNSFSALGQYKQLLENPLASLLNYSAQSYAPTSVSSTLPKNSIANQRLAQMPYGAGNPATNMKAMHGPMLTGQRANEAETSINQEKRLPQKTSKDQNSSPKTSAPQDVGQDLTIKSTSVDLTKSSTTNATTMTQSTPTQLPIPPTPTVIKAPKQLQKILPSQLSMQRPKNMDNFYPGDPKKTKITKQTNVNLTTQSSSNKSSSLSTQDLLKSNGEMQIIPTTSPPGTSSITKQLNEISPSISLTAVNTSRDKPDSITQLLQHRTNSATISPTNNKTNTNMLNSNKKVVYPTSISLTKTLEAGSPATVSISSQTPEIRKTPTISTVQTMPTAAIAYPVNKTRPIKTVAVKKIAKPESLTPNLIGSGNPKMFALKNAGGSIPTDPFPTLKKTVAPDPVHKAIRPQGTTLNLQKSAVPPRSTVSTQKPSTEAGFDKNKVTYAKSDNPNIFVRKRSPEELKGVLTAKRPKLNEPK